MFLQYQHKTLCIGLLCLLSSHAYTAETLETIEVEGSKELNAQIESKTTEQLQQQAKGDTLGDYLQQQPNVDSASYGPGVGRPVVRGMSGYRVKILQNDSEINDLSAMSQDHAVGVMPKASERIELLKGPASIIYGASAGGTIKVIHGTQNQFPEKGLKGKIETEVGSNNDLTHLGAEVSGTSETLTFGLSAHQIETQDYTDGQGQVIQDSDVLTEQARIFAGWRYRPSGKVIVSYAQLNKDYGIPNETNQPTRIDMQRDHYSLHLSETELFSHIDKLNFDFSYSDYLHNETEGQSIDGLFGQKNLQASLSADYFVNDWLGKVQLGFKKNDLKVCHEHGACKEFTSASRSGNEKNLGASIEQYLNDSGLPYSHGHPMPDTQTETWMVGVNAEKPLESLGNSAFFSLGAHIEMRNLMADPSNIQETWVVPSRVDANFYKEETEFAGSLSAGLKHLIGERLQSDINLSYLERLPSVDELYWNGFHHATDSYIFGNRYLKKERSVNLDWDLLLEGQLSDWRISAYGYYFWDYIYQDPMYDSVGNPVIDPFHLSDVWQTQQTDAIFTGVSFRNDWRITQWQQRPLTWSNQFEASLAQQSNGENLPRTAPYNYLSELSYQAQDWSTKLTINYVFAANTVAKNESETDGYTLLSIYSDWKPKNTKGDWTLWLKGENLLDEYAQNHLSFLKGTAPLMGRSLRAGVKWTY